MNLANAILCILAFTEAGDGEDGRIKSAVGIGTLLEDGLGDTIRVSLTEDPESEIPVCKDLVKRYEARSQKPEVGTQQSDFRSQTSDLDFLMIRSVISEEKRLRQIILVANMFLL